MLPLQTEHMFFFNLYMTTANRRLKKMENANATLRKYTRTREAFVERPNMQSRENVCYITFTCLYLLIYNRLCTFKGYFT